MTDKELIAFSLNMWKNYIQTGDVTLSKSDARATGNNFKESWELEESQNTLIMRIEAIRKEVLN